MANYPKPSKGSRYSGSRVKTDHTKKKNNHNSGTRQSLYEQRVAEAKARQVAWDKLAPTEKLASLDKLFGTGLGAQSQRARIADTLKRSK
jgi:hypothetical protein